MVKKINPILLIGVVVVAFIMLSNGNIFQGAITGSETMTRTGPASVNPSETFQITYRAEGASGSWGASIEDSVTGGCTFPSGNPTYKTVMLSEDGSSKTITIQAPATGSCTFSGDYKFGTFAVRDLNSYTVQACTPSCTRPTNMCTEASAVSDGCGGDCSGSWTVQRLTSADTNCDSSINRAELGIAITGWTQNTFSRTDLGSAIQSWAGG